MQHIRLRYLCFLLLFLTIFNFGCRDTTPSPAANSNSSPATVATPVVGKRGGALTYRLNNPPKTLNYLMADSEASVLVSFYLLGGHLVDFDGISQQYVPALAESWQLADDARTMDLVLRENLKFSDNYALTADDVAFSLKAVYDEKTGSPVYRDSLLIGGRKIDATVIDPRHLRLIFPESVGAPLSYLSNLAVLPRHSLEADLNAGTLGHAWGLDANPQSIVTSGPFTVDSVTPGERIVLKRNPNYWRKDTQGNQLPYLDSLTLVIIPDANNAMAQAQQGSIDIVDRIRPSDYAAARTGNNNIHVFDLGPGLLTDHIFFNLSTGTKTNKPAVDPIKAAWFNDVRFRKAISTAIDRDSIVTSTLQGLATPLYGFISPGNKQWVATDLPRSEYNLGNAKSLLSDAGFQVRGTADAPELHDSKGNRVEFSLLVQAENALRNSMAAVIQSDLAKLGIKMNVTPIDTPQLNDRVARGADFEAAFLGTSTTQPDPSSYSTFIRSDGVNHQWHPKEEKPETEWEARLDELETAQARETNDERRKAIFHDIQQIIVEQQPIVPIIARHTLTAAVPRIGNYRPSSLLPYSLWNVDELFINQ